MREQFDLFGKPVEPPKAWHCQPAGLSIITEADDALANRFLVLFARAWQRLPADVTATLLTWWERIRAHGAAALPDPSIANHADIKGLDFSTVPVIVLADDRRDGNERAGGLCFSAGLILMYYTPILEMSDYGVSEVIAHELAHAYMMALGKNAPCPTGCQKATWTRALKNPGSGWDERAVEELLAVWGFMKAEHIGLHREVLRSIVGRKKRRAAVVPIRRGRW